MPEGIIGATKHDIFREWWDRYVVKKPEPISMSSRTKPDLSLWQDYPKPAAPILDRPPELLSGTESPLGAVPEQEVLQSGLQSAGS